MADVAADITCARCGLTATPEVQIDGVAICSLCGASNRVEKGVATLAMATDLEGLSDEKLGRLRRARGAIARPSKRQR